MIICDLTLILINMAVCDNLLSYIRNVYKFNLVKSDKVIIEFNFRPVHLPHSVISGQLIVT